MFKEQLGAQVLKVTGAVSEILTAILSLITGVINSGNYFIQENIKNATSKSFIMMGVSIYLFVNHQIDWVGLLGINGISFVGSPVKALLDSKAQSISAGVSGLTDILNKLGILKNDTQPKG